MKATRARLRHTFFLFLTAWLQRAAAVPSLTTKCNVGTGYGAPKTKHWTDGNPGKKAGKAKANFGKYVKCEPPIVTEAGIKAVVASPNKILKWTESSGSAQSGFTEPFTRDKPVDVNTGIKSLEKCTMKANVKIGDSKLASTADFYIIHLNTAPFVTYASDDFICAPAVTTTLNRQFVCFPSTTSNLPFYVFPQVGMADDGNIVGDITYKKKDIRTSFRRIGMSCKVSVCEEANKASQSIAHNTWNHKMQSICFQRTMDAHQMKKIWIDAYDKNDKRKAAIDRAVNKMIQQAYYFQVALDLLVAFWLAWWYPIAQCCNSCFENEDLSAKEGTEGTSGTGGPSVSRESTSHDQAMNEINKRELHEKEVGQKCEHKCGGWINVVMYFVVLNLFSVIIASTSGLFWSACLVTFEMVFSLWLLCYYSDNPCCLFCGCGELTDLQKSEDNNFRQLGIEIRAVSISDEEHGDRDALQEAKSTGINGASANEVELEDMRKKARKEATGDRNQKVLRKKWLEICCPCWAEDRGSWDWTDFGGNCKDCVTTCPLECYDYWFMCPCCKGGPPCIFYSSVDDNEGQELEVAKDDNVQAKSGLFISQLPFYGRFPPPWLPFCQGGDEKELCFTNLNEQNNIKDLRHSLHLDEQRSRVGRISECQVKFVGLNCCVQMWALFFLFTTFQSWEVGQYYIFDRTTQTETVEIMGQTIAKIQQFLYGPARLVATSDANAIDKSILKMGTAFCGSKFNERLPTDEDKYAQIQVERIDQFQISMSAFRRTKYSQFFSINDWFTRRLDYTKRPLPMNPHAIVAPADARTITFDQVPSDQKIWIKEEHFTLSKLLTKQAGDYQDKFEGGAVIISRLAIQDYHCFHSPVNGKIIKRYSVDGILHSVGVDAMTSGSHAIFNSREIMIIDTDQDAPAGYEWTEGGNNYITTAVKGTFDAGQTTTGKTAYGPLPGTGIGKVGYVAIGAMCTGSVTLIMDGITKTGPGVSDFTRVPLGKEPNYKVNDFVTRGGFVGQMAFGGSTVAVMFEKDKVTFDQDLRFTSRMPVEQYVQVRQQVGVKMGT